MSKINKTLTKWSINTPTDAPIDKVIALIKRFFKDQYELISGSHIVIRNDNLIGRPDYGPDGDFTVPVSGGQKVKGYYLKKLADTIILLEQIEKSEEKE